MIENQFNTGLNMENTIDADNNKEQMDPIKMLDMAERVLERIEQNLQQTK